MPRYSSGKFAKRISDRSGMAFPYNEMVQEWNGSWVHISEFEAKHPQLEPLRVVSDPESLQYARRQVVNATVPLDNTRNARNIFGVKTQTVSQFNPIPAPGAFENVTVHTMLPLDNTNDQNKDIEIKSFLGKVEIVIS